MTERTRRKELVEEYKQNRPEAGVFRIVNTRTGRVLVGSTLNLASLESKMRFARSTGSTSALHFRLKADGLKFGVWAFELEVLEVLETKTDSTGEQLRCDLAVLEALWRERQDQDLLY
ncbi:MAG TPA: GIY-YIG nuclease family protein [Chloroflexota bacterium]|nr:GIY-YIG nuclease family protein [Chloroflexota bacterium]